MMLLFLTLLPTLLLDPFCRILYSSLIILGTFKVWCAMITYIICFPRLSFALSASQIKEKARVVAMDLRGHGRTTTENDNDLSIEVRLLSKKNFSTL